MSLRTRKFSRLRLHTQSTLATVPHDIETFNTGELERSSFGVRYHTEHGRDGTGYGRTDALEVVVSHLRFVGRSHFSLVQYVVTVQNTVPMNVPNNSIGTIFLCPE